MKICSVPVAHLEPCRHVLSCFVFCGPVLRHTSSTGCLVSWLTRAPVFCLDFSDSVPILFEFLKILFPAFTVFSNNFITVLSCIPVDAFIIFILCLDLFNTEFVSYK